MDLRRIAELFNEKPWEYGPIFRICSRLMSKSDRLLGTNMVVELGPPFFVLVFRQQMLKGT